MLRLVAKLLKTLNSESEPGQISLALCLSMIAGFTPLLSPHNLLVLLLVLVLRVNLSAFILGWAVFSAAAFALDPLFHRIGLAVLTAPSLTGLWSAGYNTTWFRLDRLNNTVVMGSLLVALLLFVPGLILFNLLIRRYRQHLLAWVKQTRLAQAVQASKLYAVYQTVSGWKGGLS
ncbi:MAG: TIGR03546 family protein [Desulfosarcina sp.]